ncbi:MAG TPA: hypothetical protein VFH68_26135 [Polyangia bacterium]|jgi:hypothetical protein|nr:hypothetical protein [Polyangia bacterium]
MNTLVDLKDGATQVLQTKEETAPGAPHDAAIAPRPSDATLIEVAPPGSVEPAANATLVELAPASGRTLILPDGAEEEAQRAWAHPAAMAPSAPAAAAGERAQRLFARARSQADVQDRPRLKWLAPFAVGVASLLATGIPLWFRSARPPAGGAAVEKSVGADPSPAARPAVDRDPTSPAGEPAAATTATPSAAPGGANAPAARPAGDRRGRTRVAVSPRWKNHTLVLRTRNGSPVVE